MTQKTLILSYLKEHTTIVPARMSGVIYKETMLGSETSRVCRALRAEGVLTSDSWKENTRLEEFKLLTK